MASSSPARESKLIAGVHVVPLRSFADDRGYFFESFRKSWVPGAREMVQGNVSFSKKGVLRGLHYHLKQADFWVVPQGLARAGLYDMRASSPTRGKSETIELGQGNAFGLYIPPGVAHGFCAHTDIMMTYLVDEYYDNTDERGIRWNDPALGIDWGATEVIVSDRDRQNPPLVEIPADVLPK
jgi:dTDP-4-dehydrorhamnose 3,5-epimerase